MATRKQLDEATIRRRCGALRGRFPEEPALRAIAFVGATRCVLGGRDMDSVRMTHALDYLLESEVVIHPDFEIDVVNLFHGRDFLAEETRADLVFVSFIPNVDHRLFTRIDDQVLAQQRQDPAAPGPARDETFFWQSRSSRHAAAAWQTRVLQSGARLLLCFGGSKEVGTPLFEGLPYEVLIPSPGYPCQLPYRQWPKEQLYDGVDWDVPYKWLAVMAHREYLQRPRGEGKAPPGAQTSPETMLAREMARWASCAE